MFGDWDDELSRLVPVGLIKPPFEFGSVAELKESFDTLCVRNLGVINSEIVLGVLSWGVISC